MPKRTAQKKKTAGLTAAKRRRTVPLSHAVTLGRSDLLILLALGTITFGIYAQVIGHQFITLDDPTYIRENPKAPIYADLSFFSQCALSAWPRS